MNDTETSPPKAKRESVARRLAVKRRVAIAFIQGEGSLEALGRKFSVSLAAMKAWSRAGRWTELRRAYDEREREILLRATEPAEKTPDPAPTVQTPLQVKLASVEQQIVDIDKELALNPTADVRVKLWVSKEKALNVWALLTGFPKPGVRRTGRTGRSSQPVATPAESPIPEVAQDQEQAN